MNGKISFEEFCHIAQKRPLKLDHNRVNNAALDLRTIKSIKSQKTTKSNRSRSVFRGEDSVIEESPRDLQTIIAYKNQNEDIFSTGRRTIVTAADDTSKSKKLSEL
jgi:hypothetical protein